MTKTKEEVDKLAQEHWDFIAPLIEHHYAEQIIGLMKYLYVQAFKHGYKHSEEGR